MKARAGHLVSRHREGGGDRDVHVALPESSGEETETQTVIGDSLRAIPTGDVHVSANGRDAKTNPCAGSPIDGEPDNGNKRKFNQATIRRLRQKENAEAYAKRTVLTQGLLLASTFTAEEASSFIRLINKSREKSKEALNLCADRAARLVILEHFLRTQPDHSWAYVPCGDLAAV